MDPDLKKWLISTGKSAGIMFLIMAVASVIGLIILQCT